MTNGTTTPNINPNDDTDYDSLAEYSLRGNSKNSLNAMSLGDQGGNMTSD